MLATPKRSPACVSMRLVVIASGATAAFHARYKGSSIPVVDCPGGLDARAPALAIALRKRGGP